VSSEISRVLFAFQAEGGERFEFGVTRTTVFCPMISRWPMGSSSRRGDMISPLRTWHGGGFSATDLPSRKKSEAEALAVLAPALDLEAGQCPPGNRFHKPPASWTLVKTGIAKTRRDSREGRRPVIQARPA